MFEQMKKTAIDLDTKSLNDDEVDEKKKDKKRLGVNDDDAG